VATTAYTKWWFGEQHALEFHDDPEQPAFTEFTFTMPPWNGFGDLLDSEQNCKKLIAKPPKKDLFKYLDNPSTYLFKARSEERNGDVLEYILRWYDCDDTLEI